MYDILVECDEDAKLFLSSIMKFRIRRHQVSNCRMFEQDAKAHTMAVLIVGCAETHSKLLTVHSHLGFAAIITITPTSETWEHKLVLATRPSSP